MLRRQSRSSWCNEAIIPSRCCGVMFPFVTFPYTWREILPAILRSDKICSGTTINDGCKEVWGVIVSACMRSSSASSNGFLHLVRQNSRDNCMSTFCSKPSLTVTSMSSSWIAKGRPKVMETTLNPAVRFLKLRYHMGKCTSKRYEPTDPSCIWRRICVFAFVARQGGTFDMTRPYVVPFPTQDGQLCQLKTRYLFFSAFSVSSATVLSLTRAQLVKKGVGDLECYGL